MLSFLFLKFREDHSMSHTHFIALTHVQAWLTQIVCNMREKLLCVDSKFRFLPLKFVDADVALLQPYSSSCESVRTTPLQAALSYVYNRDHGLLLTVTARVTARAQWARQQPKRTLRIQLGRDAATSWEWGKGDGDELRVHFKLD